MARQNSTTISLESAIALLLHKQAEFVKEMSDINRRHNELMKEVDRRFKQD